MGIVIMFFGLIALLYGVVDLFRRRWRNSLLEFIGGIVVIFAGPSVGGAFSHSQPAPKSSPQLIVKVVGKPGTKFALDINTVNSNGTIGSSHVNATVPYSKPIKKALSVTVAGEMTSSHGNMDIEIVKGKNIVESKNSDVPSSPVTILTH